MDGRAQLNPAAFADTPMYNIQAVAAATGIPTITLRSWERRYGVPQPKRDQKGYRLYSDRDIAVARWLKERVQQGISISRAINMYRTLERQGAVAEPSRTLDFASLQSRLLDAIKQIDEAELNQVLAEALTISSVEDVCLSLVQPTLYRVGDMWATGELSSTVEHFGSYLLRASLAHLARITPPPLRSARVLVACAPLQAHDIGALMLALFLRRRGYGVMYVGANPKHEDLLKDIVDMHPDAVCLSATMDDGAAAISAVFRELMGVYPGILAFGGQAFNGNSDIIRSTPGVFLGENAATATDALQALLSRRTLATA